MAELKITVRPSDKTPKPTESIVPKTTEGQITTVPPQFSDPENIKRALSSGYNAAQLVDHMTNNGVDILDATKLVNENVKLMGLRARELGAKDEDIKQSMLNNGYDPSVADFAVKASTIGKEHKKYSYNPEETIDNATDIADLYRNIHTKYSTTAKSILGTVDEEAGISARRDMHALNRGIVDTLKARGYNASINPEDGEVLVTDEKGVVTPVDDSFINSLVNSKFELGSAVAGAAIGAQIGAMGGPFAPVTVPAGVVIGGSLGAATGRGADITVNAYQLKERVSRDLYKRQMIEAGLFDVVTGIVGAGLYKAGGASYKGIVKAYDYIVEGQADRAFAAIKDELHLSDDAAKEIIDNFKSALDGKLVKETRKTLSTLTGGLIKPGSKELSESEYGTIAVATTQPLAEGITRQAASESHKVANAIITGLDTRAKSLNKEIAKLSDPNIGAKVRADLNSYEADVKKFYGAVKDQGISHVHGTDYAFDLDKIAIEPVMKQISAGISDPTIKERFLLHAERIGAATSDRSFSGLLELRSAVNDFKYGKNGLKPSDIEALNTVLNNIDGQVSKAAKEYIPNHSEWLANFSKAKTEYAKMKVLQENKMYNEIMADTTEAGIRRSFNKWGNDKDVDSEIFNAVAERVSPKTRSLMEVSAIENLANKYTLGKVTDYQAVNFPALAEELKLLNVKTQEGKTIAKAVDDISKIFKNDPALSKVSGYIPVNKASTALTDNLATKVKFHLVSQVWHTLRSRLPGEAGRNSALVLKTAELLKDPLKVKTVDAFMKEIPEASSSEMRSLVKELQAQAVATGTKKVDKEWQYMYKQNSDGKLVETDGAWGRGLYLFDKVKHPTPGAKIVKHEVNLTRMATLDDVSSIVGRTVTPKELKTLNESSALYKQLQDSGYIGIKFEDKAMLFPETTVGAKKGK